MAVGIYKAEQEWLTRAEVTAIASQAFSQWSPDAISALYGHQSGEDTPEEQPELEHMIAYLAGDYGIAYERMAEIVDNTYAPIRLGGVRIVQFAGDEYDPTAWDDVAILFHYRDFGDLPEILDPTLPASDEEYLPNGANFTTNPAFLDAFRHTARTHPDPAVRLAIIADPLMPWTLDDLIGFAQDPDRTVRTAVTGMVVAAAV